MTRSSALSVLQENDQGQYTVPARGLYPHQWNWDSAFIALGWAAFDVDRAYRELLSLVGGQAASGMIPHIVFHPEPQTYLPGPEWWGSMPGADGRLGSGITQPPVAATCLRLLFDYAPKPQETNTILRSLVHWHHMLLTDRASEYGEPILVHPWETGQDNAISWDPALRNVPEITTSFTRRDLDLVPADQRPPQPFYKRYLFLVEQFAAWECEQPRMARESAFRILDPGFSSILLRACRDAEYLANRLDAPDLAAECRAHVEQLKKSLTKRADADGLVWPLDLITGKEEHSHSAIYALNILREDLPATTVTRLAAEITEGGLSSRYGMRTLERDHPERQASNYCRGPVWVSTSFLAALGLSAHGRYVAAGALLDRTESFAQQGGWYEYMEAGSGKGLGIPGFSWTAALYAWIRRPKRESGIALPLL